MDLLMLSDVYFPRVNGVSTSIRTFARALAGKGHAVTVVAPDYGPDSGQERHDGQGEFELVRLPARVVFFDPEDRLIRAPDARRALDALARRRWDAIHIHTPFRAHAMGLRLARRAGAPTVETYHTYFEEYVGHYLPWLPAPATRFFARRASRWLCDAVDHLVVPSEQMAQVLQRYGVRTPASVIPTGIDLAEFAGGDGARFRAKHGIEPDRPTLVTVSRLSAEKNIAFLLEVVRRLREPFPRLLFLIAGEGPDAPRLRRLVAEWGLDGHVRFFGNLDRRTELLDAYRAGDAFVFASPTETQGLVLIEAMALGVPIVSTAVMGTATVLREARSALVAEADVDAFAGQVARLLRSPELRAELAAHGPRDAQAWGGERMAARMEALYAGLARGAPATARAEGAR
ncbi:glycosyltransferase [Vulcaniibacterium tengchongense]|uniref:Glycosyltransferase involved in cell wall biosynthesis n=1 Tax=Vulcaniibacterium tengchongense TaxID=1273429 RepID=A0A3N4VPU4_9GAMM|nr:glycosyltransferase [Vulcaniibacterium tengchongense]RPE81909.1 glycosyltransferase involved in cell wall biosynthesis [Vulcaniibacterium tengchongense]